MLLSHRYGRIWTKITDFGSVAQLAHADASVTASRHSALYVPPEGWAKPSRYDIRSDLYQAGLVLFEMVHGSLPCNGDAYLDQKAKRELQKLVTSANGISSFDRSQIVDRALARAASGKGVTAIRKKQPYVLRNLARIINKAVASDPAARYQTPSDMIGRLEALRLPDWQPSPCGRGYVAHGWSGCDWSVAPDPKKPEQWIVSRRRQTTRSFAGGPQIRARRRRVDAWRKRRREHPPRPSDALGLFERLAQWGEVAAYEATDLRAAAWISVFESSGALTAVDDDRGHPVAWHLAPRFVRLLESDVQQVGRRLCFAVPEYRAYLVSILVEGLADAARAGMSAALEDWTHGDLAPLLPELNATLDLLESGRRLIDLSQRELDDCLSSLSARTQDFSDWDAFALGQSAHPKTLFEFALRRFGPVSGPLPVVESPSVVLRALPLNGEDGFDLGDTSLPEPWNTRRFGILGCY